MTSASWLLGEKYGTRIVKDGCGIFGILRKKGSSKISSITALKGIACIKYRGSNLGAGYASFCASDVQNKPNHIMAFVSSKSVAESIKSTLAEIGEFECEDVQDGSIPRPMKIWSAEFYPRDEDEFEKKIDEINQSLISDNEIAGRIISYGKYVRVYKEVGFPSEVASLYGLDSGEQEADLWIAHTRQPTNSPGTLPIWSHPFSSMECAIAHNGDISSFGNNVELLKSWGLKSHIGTDSEVIARLLDRLIRKEKLGVRLAATILTNPYERFASKESIDLLSKYRSARLDGPFAVVGGYSDGEDVYLIALSDRSKFRPLIFGEDDEYIYVASEESQIRLISPDAKVWTPEPGRFLIASTNKGVIERGTSESIEPAPVFETPSSFRKILAQNLSFSEINEIIVEAYRGGEKGIEFLDISGQRYIGIGFSQRASPTFKVRLSGYPGNCLGNLNNGLNFEIFGNVADDVADTMHSGSIIIHGNARDVLGQALQGGSIFVRGSVGNRAAIQMREYEDDKPFLIVGERADDYLGEYMAGGVACILNLSDSKHPVGNYLATGMVGGRIYIRGKIGASSIGLCPNKIEILNYLETALVDGRINPDIYRKIAQEEFLDERVLESTLPFDLFERIRFLFFVNKYSKPPLVRTRKLDKSDLLLLESVLRKFFEAFNISSSEYQRVIDSEFTVIEARQERNANPLPPQEIPVEE
ncbi:MAG: GltB/FmdC/FwdC-like GXGXG domain-containing protein [Nitrososphaerales archaeon]